MGQVAQERAFVGAHVDSLTRAELLALARREDRSLASIIRRALAAELARADINETGDAHE
jgi:hypothetical protein